ncbi:NAD(P)-dependent oxidoreductase [Streptomyces niveus]|uniref:NAD(P)-dependent oxidoreductase n=1 Tax=Streptomyces niveus TaxID=193462 RepID=UPI0036AC3FA5
MEPAAAALVPPDDVRARLSTLVRLDPAPPGTDPPAALAEAEILVSGWGCPRLTAEVRAGAPRPRALMHAAGTVRPLVGEALWERGIVVSPAADALTAECATGRLEAYLDVTNPEPLPPGHPLLSLPNVLVTPHTAGAQGSEVRRLGQYAVAEVARWPAGEPLLGEVTREALPRPA